MTAPTITVDVLREGLRLADKSTGDLAWRKWAEDHAEPLARALLSRLEAEAAMPVALPGLHEMRSMFDGVLLGATGKAGRVRALTEPEAREVVRRCRVAGALPGEPSGCRPAESPADRTIPAPETGESRRAVDPGWTVADLDVFYDEDSGTWCVRRKGDGKTWVPLIAEFHRADFGEQDARAFAEVLSRSLVPSAPSAAPVAPSPPGRVDVAPEAGRAVEGRQGAMDALAILVDRLTPWDGETLDEAQRVIERELARLRAVLEGFLLRAEQALARRRNPGGQQVMPPQWGGVPISVLLEVERDCRRALALAPDAGVDHV